MLSGAGPRVAPPRGGAWRLQAKPSGSVERTAPTACAVDTVGGFLDRYVTPVSQSGFHRSASPLARLAKSWSPRISPESEPSGTSAAGELGGAAASRDWIRLLRDCRLRRVDPKAPAPPLRTHRLGPAGPRVPDRGRPRSAPRAPQAAAAPTAAPPPAPPTGPRADRLSAGLCRTRRSVRSPVRLLPRSR